ncbi:MOG interacting and ectopic P-granules protein 1-like [Diorhabda carinulata]|uniref:MOG interacting and ectopic P-granules protein 1-like n=1 Tax=Diorhabda carinulata TaxID=1163345 RepID=UPI00259FE1BB|nr:MOG interacting and ectopic P-granules protein 1-like [Diorhabda carinulata]
MVKPQSKSSRRRRSKKLKTNEKVMMVEHKEISLPSTLTSTCKDFVVETIEPSKNTLDAPMAVDEISEDWEIIAASSNMPSKKEYPPVNSSLPSLTEDMFIIEAPSFIVNYIYEKPPLKSFAGQMNEKKQKIDGDAKKNEEKADVNDCGNVKLKMKGVDNKPRKKGAKTDSKHVTDANNASYFDRPSAKFFMDIGLDLVQEYVQNDVLSQQKRGSIPETVQMGTSLNNTSAINKEKKTLVKKRLKKCKSCNFKTDSSLVMSQHLEMPHLKNFLYYCNFCPYKVKKSRNILKHIKLVHGIQGRIEKIPKPFQCSNCPYESYKKGRMKSHLVNCMKTFKLEQNLAPPIDWSPPATEGLLALKVSTFDQYLNLSKIEKSAMEIPLKNAQNAVNRFEGPSTSGANVNGQPKNKTSIVTRQNQSLKNRTRKLTEESIDLILTASKSAKPVDIISDPTSVVCEICSGYLKNFELLKYHLEWIHKIKIHPKINHKKPPLKCQVCNFGLLSEQGLGRHLLGLHGLVTPKLQQAAMKNEDSGICIICGLEYGCNILKHVSMDHNKTLKQIDLFYQCLVCTVKFEMYQQFENHVYSIHTAIKEE